MKRKILMMLLTFSMSAAMLAGCSKDDTEKDTNTSEGITTEAAENNNDTSEDTSSAEKTLSDYFAEPGIKEQMDSSMEAALSAYGSTYSDVSYEIDGNTIVYIYVFKDPMSVDEATQETLDAELSKTVKDQNLIGIMEQQSGVKGISIQYIYRNPDGTEVFNGTYSE